MYVLLWISRLHGENTADMALNTTSNEVNYKL